MDGLVTIMSAKTNAKLDKKKLSDITEMLENELRDKFSQANHRLTYAVKYVLTGLC
jgi:hypothetical protein